MGLDMYLDKHVWVGDVDGWRYDEKPELRRQPLTIKEILGGEALTLDMNKTSEIVQRAMYWRKANAIHKWFVDNVQDGNDDCRLAYVDIENIKNLLDIINEVLVDHSKAEKLLPVEAGFFFGGQEYDEYYFKELMITSRKLTELLSDPLIESGHATLYYRSSW